MLCKKPTYSSPICQWNFTEIIRFVWFFWRWPKDYGRIAVWFGTWVQRFHRNLVAVFGERDMAIWRWGRLGTVTIFVPAECCVFIPWWWRWHLPAIHRYVPTKLHSVTSQKNQIIHRICTCITLCKLRKSNIWGFGGETKQTIWQTSVQMDPEQVWWEGLALGDKCWAVVNIVMNF